MCHRNTGPEIMNELSILADAVKASAERAANAIDDALEFVAASEQRIAELEAAAKKYRRHSPSSPLSSRSLEARYW